MPRIYILLLVAALLVLSVSCGDHKTQSIDALLVQRHVPYHSFAFYLSSDTCQWVLKLTTGPDSSAATNATISMYIIRPLGLGHFALGNLNRYSRRRGQTNYLPFRKSQVDFFEFRGPCPFPMQSNLPQDDRICSITFENSGTGGAPAWQLASAEASITHLSLPITELRAPNVNTWMGENRPPYNAKATVNFCTGAVTTGSTKPTKKGLN